MQQELFQDPLTNLSGAPAAQIHRWDKWQFTADLPVGTPGQRSNPAILSHRTYPRLPANAVSPYIREDRIVPITRPLRIERLMRYQHFVILPVVSLGAGVVYGFGVGIWPTTPRLEGGQAWPARPERARSPLNHGMIGRKPGERRCGSHRACACGVTRQAAAGRRGCPPWYHWAGSPAQHSAPCNLPLSSLLWPPPQRPATADSRPRANLGSHPAPASCRNHPVPVLPGRPWASRGTAPVQGAPATPARPPGVASASTGSRGYSTAADG